MGVTPAPLGLGLPGHFPGVTSSLSAISGMVSATAASHLPGWLVLQRQRLGYSTAGCSEALLALRPHLAQECKGHLQISPLKGVHLKGGG